MRGYSGNSFRVIPTLTHLSDIVSDISFGSIYSDILSGIYSDIAFDILSGTYPDILSDIITWNWHLFWHSIWHEYTGLLHSIRSWQKEKSERRRRWGQVGGAGVAGSRRREEGEGVAPLLKSSWHLETLTWQVGNHRGNKEGKQHQAFDYEQNCDFMLRELMLLYTSLYIHELGHWSAARSKSRCGHGRNGPGGHPFEDCDVAILFARETWHVSSRDGQQTLGTQQHATSYYPYSRRPWVQHFLLDQAMPVSACQCLCLDVIVSQQVFDLVSIAICFGSHVWPTSLLCFSVLWCVYIYIYICI